MVYLRIPRWYLAIYVAGFFVIFGVFVGGMAAGFYWNARDPPVAAMVSIVLLVIGAALTGYGYRLRRAVQLGPEWDPPWRRTRTR